MNDYARPDDHGARCVEQTARGTTEAKTGAENHVSGGKSALLSSSHGESCCVRCGEPKHRAAAHAIYCAGCAGVVHRERLRRQKRVGGSRAQLDRMMAAWRDGTIARVLERMEAAGD